MARKPYSPLASYAELKRVEAVINQAQTVEDVRRAVEKDGPKVGYKAFCYLLTGRMTPEAMKPDEACATAASLEAAGKIEQAMDIYKKVAAVHPDHPLVQGKVS